VVVRRNKPSRETIHFLTEQDVSDVRHYLQSVPLAATQNALNKLHLWVKKDFTPGGIVFLLERTPVFRLPGRFREFARFALPRIEYVLNRVPWFPAKKTMYKWLGEPKWRLYLDEIFRTHERQLTQPLFVNQILPGVTYYTSAQPSRKLIVAFPPLHGYMTLPGAGFLAVVQHAGADLLMIAPLRNQQSPWLEASAIPGGHEGLLEFVHGFARSHAYDETHVVGLSFGSTLALVAGLRLQATTVTTVGLAKDTAYFESTIPDIWQLMAAKYDPDRIRLSFVAGDQVARDVDVAGEMARTFPRSTAHVVQGSPHDVFDFLYRRNLLEGFLEDMIRGFGPPEVRD